MNDHEPRPPYGGQKSWPRVNVILHPDLERRLRAAAEAEGIALATMARKLIVEGLDRRG